jgi:hypothetical protein
VIDAGYFAKVVASRPAFLKSARVREICSVSLCISAGPDDWVGQWRHNWLGWFNAPDDAWSVVPEEDRSRYRLFGYRLGPIRFNRGTSEPVTIPDDVHPLPIPESFVSLGYDAVNKSMESVLGFECSPMSCNSMADEIEANDYCLFSTEADATSAANRFSVEQPEPGVYYVVQVLEAPGARGRPTRG